MDKSTEQNVEGFRAKLVWMFVNVGHYVEKNMGETFYVCMKAMSG